MTEAVGHPRPAFRIADLFRRHRKQLEGKYVLNLDQRRLLGAIVLCRTPALGGHVAVCQSCSAQHPVWHGCRKRGCPTCQALAQEKWIATRRERILPIRHFHVVFTLPSELRWLALYHPALVYGAFFRAVGELLAELGKTELGVTLGWTLVLHTWKRDMGLHIHIHAIVTAGGLLLDGSAFKHVTANYLFSCQVMGEMLRGKMLDALRCLQAKDAFPELEAGPRPNFLDHQEGVINGRQSFDRPGHAGGEPLRSSRRTGAINPMLLLKAPAALVENP